MDADAYGPRSPFPRVVEPKTGAARAYTAVAHTLFTSTGERGPRLGRMAACLLTRRQSATPRSPRTVAML